MEPVARAYSITGPLYTGGAREKKVRARREAVLFEPETRRHLLNSKRLDEKNVELYKEEEIQRQYATDYAVSMYRSIVLFRRANWS